MERLIDLKLILCMLCWCVWNYDAVPVLQNDILFQPLRIGGRKNVAFQDCGSMYDILQLSIEGCEQVPCKLGLGSMVQVNSEYNDHGEDDHVLKHDVYWVLNAVNTKAFVTPQACEGRFCPFRGFEGMAFAADLFVNNSLPALGGLLYWEVFNDADELVMCYKIPIAITF